MLFTGISPVHKFDDIFVKREDLAYWSSLKYPSGSKVRQYLSMAGWVNTSEGPGIRFSHLTDDMEVFPCLVGCSADSAMQIYVAATAKQLNTKGIIYVPQRKKKSQATQYAESLGAEVNFVPLPGWLSRIERQAKNRANALNRNVVRWDRVKAIQDTVAQCANIPEGVKRIIVPTGSGLTAAGVLVGTKDIEIVAVRTSPKAEKSDILRFAYLVKKDVDDKRLTAINYITPYSIPAVASLPDDTPLDPFYAAKAWGYMQPGDLLWPPGLRPVIAMPEICQRYFQQWKGPKE